MEAQMFSQLLGGKQEHDSRGSVPRDLVTLPLYDCFLTY